MGICLRDAHDVADVLEAAVKIVYVLRIRNAGLRIDRNRSGCSQRLHEACHADELPSVSIACRDKGCGGAQRRVLVVIDIAGVTERIAAHETQMVSSRGQYGLGVDLEKSFREFQIDHRADHRDPVLDRGAFVVCVAIGVGRTPTWPETDKVSAGFGLEVRRGE